MREITYGENIPGNCDTLRDNNYKIPISIVEENIDADNDCYECRTCDNGNGETLCQKIDCDKEDNNDANTNTNSSEINPDDTVFDAIDSNVHEKIKNQWGVKLSASGIAGKVGGKTYYKTKIFKGSSGGSVFLVSDSADGKVYLVMDPKEGNEKAVENEGIWNSVSDFNRWVKDSSDSDIALLFNQTADLNESFKTMKNILKEEVRKRRVEERVINNRFSLIQESPSARGIFNEVTYLRKNKYSEVLIKEGLVELIQAMYGDDPNSGQKIKDSYKNFMVSKLPNEGDLFNKSLETGLNNLNDDEIPNIFMDCNTVVEIVYQNMVENLVNVNFDVQGVPDDIEAVIKMEVIDNLKQDKMRDTLKKQLTKKICPLYGELQTRTTKAFDDMKGKLLA